MKKRSSATFKNPQPADTTNRANERILSVLLFKSAMFCNLTTEEIKSSPSSNNHSLMLTNLPNLCPISIQSSVPGEGENFFLKQTVDR